MTNTLHPEFVIKDAFSDLTVDLADVVQIEEAVFEDEVATHQEIESITDGLSMPDVYYSHPTGLTHLETLIQHPSGLTWKDYLALLAEKGLQPLTTIPSGLDQPKTDYPDISLADITFHDDKTIEFSYNIGKNRTHVVLGETLETSFYTVNASLPREASWTDLRIWFDLIAYHFQRTVDLETQETLGRILRHLEILNEELSPQGMVNPNTKGDTLYDQWLFEKIKALAREGPLEDCKLTDVRVCFYGEVEESDREAVQKALKAFHPSERKRLKQIAVFILDLKKTVEEFEDQSGSNDLSSIPVGSQGGIGKIVVVSYPEVQNPQATEAVLIHELGHDLENRYQLFGPNRRGGDNLFGLSHHFRHHVRENSKRHNRKGSTSNLISTKDPLEWWTEGRRVMMEAHSPHPGFLNLGVSNQEEFASKDPVGFLVFKKYRQFLEEGDPHPEKAFSVTAFHLARELVGKIGSPGLELVTEGQLHEPILLEWMETEISPYGQTLPQAESLVQEGDRLYDQENYLAAEQKYREALKLVPEYSYARFCLAYAFLAQGKYNEAHRIAWHLYRDDPLYFDATLLLAKIYESNEDYGAAIGCYQKLSGEYPSLDALLLKKIARLKHSGT